MKRLVESLIAGIVATALFTLSMYANVLQDISVSIFVTSAIYLAAGYVLNTWFNRRHVTIPFAAVTMLLVTFAFTVSDLKYLVGWLFLALLLSLSVGWLTSRYPWRTRAFLLIGLVAALCSITYAVVPRVSYAHTEYNNPGLVDRSLYSFQDEGMILRDFRGRSMDLQALCADKVCLLEFYFHGCKPCVVKEADLSRVSVAMEGKPFQLIYIDAGNIDSFERFQKRRRSGFRVHDEGGKLTASLSVQAFPTEFIIDRHGIIRHASTGYGEQMADVYVAQTLEKIKGLL